MSTAKNLVSDSGNVECYTPKWIVKKSALVMGGIDLDPASCEQANKFVGAKTFYTKEMDGFSMPWFGKVWLNHPFGKFERACQKSKVTGEYLCKKKKCLPGGSRGHHIDHDIMGNNEWIGMLLSHVESGAIEQAISLTFVNSDSPWWQKLARFPQLFFNERVDFYDESGDLMEGITKGSCLTFINCDMEAVRREFSGCGVIK